MPQPNQPIPYQILEEIYIHNRAMRLPDVGKKSAQKLTKQQIEDFHRVGKITEEQAAQLLMELDGHA